jgi:hypothetical protein
MKFAPESLYRNAPKSIVVLFDMRIPGGAERLHRQRASWGAYGDIEALDQDHYALVIRPGGVHGE